MMLIGIGGDGSVLSTTPLLDPEEQLFSATVTEMSGGFVVAWESSHDKPLFPLSVDLWSARLSSMGGVLEKKLLVPTMTHADNRFARSPAPPDLATNGSTALVAWAVSPVPIVQGDAIMGLLLRPTDTGQPIAIATKATDKWVEALAPNGANFLLVWEEAFTSLRANRITRSGDSLDPDGILITDLNGGGSADAAFDGEATVIVWDDSTGIHGTRVDTEGRVVGPPFQISTRRGAPSVACSNTICLVAWNEVTEEQGKLHVARVRKGIVLDANGVFVAEGAEFAITSNGESFLLAMVRPATPGGAILSAALIEGADQSLSVNASNFAASTLRMTSPQAVWDGERYVVAWWEGVLRASLINDEGHSIDGEQTSWRGTEIPGGLFPRRLAILGNTIAVASHGRELVMLSRESLQIEQRLDLDIQAQTVEIVGRSDGGGVVAHTRRAEEPLYFHANRAFFRTAGQPARSRAAKQRGN